MQKVHYSCPCLDLCPLHKSMEIIGGKWKIQIICALNTSGPTRYNGLKKKLDGISNTMMAQSLKELEKDGLIVRREYLEVPVRVEYETTERCNKLIPILDALSDWCEEHYL